MYFKLNPISAACAAVAASMVATQAHAVLNPFDDPAAGPSGGFELFLSGASAPQNTLGAIATQFFDAAEGIHVYYDDGGTPADFTDDGRSYRAYYGVIKSGAPVPANLVGQRVRIIDRAKGGSVFGVNPVARAQAIATMEISAANCPNFDAGNSRWTCAETGDDTNPADPGNRVPDFGVSDVAPFMFKEPFNVEAGAGQLSTDEAAKLDAFGVNALMMGLVATDGVPNGTRFSRADYGSLLSGGVADWGDLNATTAALAGKPVVVCRRSPGSGTQASYNWFFNNFPCTSNSLAGDGSTAPANLLDNINSGSYVSGTGSAADPLTFDPSLGLTIVENGSSGRVRDCLSNAAAGTDYTTTLITDLDGDSNPEETVITVLFSSTGANTPAVGVLSLDSRGREDGWTFRSLDGAGHIDPVTGDAICDTAGDCGIAPTKANLLAANYEFAAELSMQYRNALVNGVPALAGDEQAFADAFIAAAGDPAVIENISNVFLRDASAALPINFPASDADVADATRFGNMCAPLQKQQ